MGYPIREQLRDLFPYLILAGVMGMAAYAAGLLPFPNHWSMLLVQIIIGIVTYVSLCRLFRLAAFMEFWHAGWNRMPFPRAGTAE